MIGMYQNTGTLIGLVLFSGLVTIATNWIQSGSRSRTRAQRSLVIVLTDVLLSLIWIALLCAMGVLAIRYIERLDIKWAGYLAYGILAIVLSVVRARLFQRIETQDILRFWDNLVHWITYPLTAFLLYLLVAWLAGLTLEPVLFIPLCLGLVVPNIRCPALLASRLPSSLFLCVEDRLGQHQTGHSLTENLLAALLSAPLIPLIGVTAWGLFSLGYLAHLIVDSLHPDGIPLFWPIVKTRYCVLGKVAVRSHAEHVLAGVLSLSCLLFILAIGASPTPSQTPPEPTFEQSLAQYYLMRGRNLVFARVHGSWQQGGRRIGGTFEVLNAEGQSFVLRDRYDGTIFTAGRESWDNLYLNSVSLFSGSPVRIKPVEVQVKAGSLTQALPVLYDMQSEPGLEHIFVSGDVLLPVQLEPAHSTLDVDLAQGRLRKTEAQSPGHYVLRYLTATELIALAETRVEAASLLIVATYTSPAVGPTVTPLPAPNEDPK